MLDPEVTPEEASSHLFGCASILAVFALIDVIESGLHSFRQFGIIFTAPAFALLMARVTSGLFLKVPWRGSPFRESWPLRVTSIALHVGTVILVLLSLRGCG
jgi:uncharacterized membrane protein YwaF